MKARYYGIIQGPENTPQGSGLNLNSHDTGKHHPLLSTYDMSQNGVSRFKCTTSFTPPSSSRGRYHVAGFTVNVCQRLMVCTPPKWPGPRLVSAPHARTPPLHLPPRMLDDCRAPRPPRTLTHPLSLSLTDSCDSR